MVCEHLYLILAAYVHNASGILPISWAGTNSIAFYIVSKEKYYPEALASLPTYDSVLNSSGIFRMLHVGQDFPQPLSPLDRARRCLWSSRSLKRKGRCKFEVLRLNAWLFSTRRSRHKGARRAVVKESFKSYLSLDLELISLHRSFSCQMSAGPA